MLLAPVRNFLDQIDVRRSLTYRGAAFPSGSPHNGKERNILPAHLHAEGEFYFVVSLCYIPSLIVGPSFRLPELTEDQQLSVNPLGLPCQTEMWRYLFSTSRV